MIYLVRHGQSEWNLARRTQGQIPHPGLTGLGRRQARAAARAIRADAGRTGRPPTSVVTSDLARAAQTATVLAGALAAPLHVDRRWREQGFGRLEGLGYEATSAALAAGPAPGGEPDHQVMLRAAEALDAIAAEEVTVIVTHGDTIRCLVAHLVGTALYEDLSGPVPNGAVIAVDPAAGGGIRRLVGRSPAGH